MEIALVLLLLLAIATSIALVLWYVRTLEAQLRQKTAEERTLRATCQEERSARFEAEKQLELMSERYSQIEKRMQDWETSRQEAVHHAKAAIFEAGSQLSGKLLEEHKRETQEAKHAATSATLHTTEQLHNHMRTLAQHVAALKGKVDESADTLALVKRSLLSPVGAGSLAEITLENILNVSGLVKGRDFIMQYTISSNEDGHRLRPDAVLFLPADNILVIDSKASKFFLELAQAEGGHEEQMIYDKLKITMRNHLKSLAAKEYKDAVRSQLRKSDQQRTIRHISAIMFIPSDAALEQLCKADPEFQHKALEADIIPTGPAGIINILSLTRFQIAEEKQLNNHTAILEETSKLLANLNVMADHARRLGNALQSSVSHYDKFAASFNSKLLPRASTIQRLGLNAQNNKPAPTALERYQLISQNSNAVIDAESDAVTAEPPLPPLTLPEA